MTAAPVKVFYSYAHEDAELLEKLKTHLAGLKQRKLISEWQDADISAGTEWDKEIVKQLDSADVILLLVSPDFISSDYVNNVELKKAIERHKEGTARVIPIILRPVEWDGLPFSNLKALPSDARPVTSWPNRDEAFRDIARGIVTTIAELNLHPPLSLTEENVPRLSPLSHIEPRSAVGFVPRKDRDGNDIIEQLLAELAPGSSRVIALWGAGGVGKTALAAEAVRSLIDGYNQRVAWISADGRDEFGLLNLLDEISNQFGHPEFRTLALEVKKKTLHAAVAETPSLIVLDNFETVKPNEQSLCLDWLSHLAPSSALITTRARIELPTIRNLPIKAMLASEASEFLDRLVKQAQHRRTFEGIDKERLIGAAEGNPLILQWVFAQIDLAQDWNEVLDELSQGEGDAAHRVFDRSFNLPLLDNGGRAALLALSLFVPSASRSALAEVAGLSGERNKKKFKEAIRHLAALWLIRTTEDSTHVTVEGLTRDLAKARLGSDQRSVAIRQRFISRFTNFANNNSEETISDLNALEAEKENLLTAVDLAIATRSWKPAVDIYLDISNFLYIRGYWDEVLSRAEKASRAALQIDDKHALGSITENMANIRQDRGEYSEAEKIYREVLEVFRALKADKEIAITLMNLGILQSRKGDFQQAEQSFRDSLVMSERLGNHIFAGRALTSLGGLAFTIGEPDRARELISSALKLFEKLRSQRGIAESMSSLGFVEVDQGELLRGRQLYLDALKIEKRLGNQSGIASSLISVGSLARQQGQIEEALKLCKEGLEIAKRLAKQRSLSSALHALGQIAFDQENLTDARQLFEMSLEISQRLGDRLGTASSFHELGNLDLAEGQLDSAEALLTQSYDMLRMLNAKRYFATALEILGRLKIIQGSHSEAKDFLREALEIAELLKQKLNIANVKRSWALLAERENNTKEAIKLLRESLNIFEYLRSPKAVKVIADLNRLDSSG